MDVFFDVNNEEHYVYSYNGVEEKINVTNNEVVGYVATLDSEPCCSISQEVYEKLKEIYK